MRSFALLTTFFTIAAAGPELFSRTCKDIAISPAGVLTATCNNKNQQPQSASLDLNAIVGVSSEINPTYLAFHYPPPATSPPAGFIPYCSNCQLETRPDPIYGDRWTFVWMYCSCGSPAATLDLNLDHGIGNDDGKLWYWYV